MRLIKGKKIAEEILRGLKSAIKKEKLKPALAVVLVGHNKASEVYVSLKKKAAEKIGIGFQLYKFSGKSGETEVVKKIKELNKDKKISGIIVQLPLPKKFHAQKIINAVDSQKDADGFHPENLRLFLKGKGKIFPVLPKAIIKFLKRSFRKKSAVVIANSDIFGKIMSVALKKEKINSEYILAVEIKKNMPKIKEADIIISVVGKPNLIKGDMIKKGAVIIDGGISKIGKKVLGDVNFQSVKNKASYITPVPGGVGPVTIACLLENVYMLAKQKSR